MRDGGVLKPGAYADVVIFDLNEISNIEDPLEPRHYPKGIHCVIVNGKIVVRNKKHTGVRAGKVLRLH
ncbi:MAG: D-glutamate deacylase [Candidatus Bathyarchaeota archaeon BA1]|nr:MAG: D-glutamate deacylase [Candidatus Bathyarchaeota archaeon BA1]